MSEKLQKVLANRGYGSRRQMEQWITAGRVTVNGRVATLGDRVEESAAIVVDGKPSRREAAVLTRVLLLNKPAAVICTRKDEQGRPTVFTYLPKIHSGRWIIVGRLDFNTSGLLLVTNDGALANRLMHPSSEMEREYSVRLFGAVDAAITQRLLKGVTIDGEMMRFHRIEAGGASGSNQWYRVVLKEGKYREVRRLWESQGVQVNRLIRIRFGSLLLPRKLRMGEYVELSPEQVASLQQEAGANTAIAQ